MQRQLQRIVRSFPRDGMTAAIGYGSGVFRQRPHSVMNATSSSGQISSTNMIDLIFAVDDTLSWHRANLTLHPSHYSFLRFGGVPLIDQVQRKVPVDGIYYNTLIPWDDHTTIKYGVMSTKALLLDLQEWRHLYVAGRLQKPVEWVVQGGALIASAQRQNLEAALAAALLVLPATFTETELFLAITGLSYHGDWRMIFGEDKGKIENIVSGQLANFRLLYGPLLYDNTIVDWKNRFTDLLLRDTSPEAEEALLLRLPFSFLCQLYGRNTTNRGREELARVLAENPALGLLVSSGLRRIVRQSSVLQTVKALVTAGLSKSLVYSGKKLTKMFRGLISTV